MSRSILTLASFAAALASQPARADFIQLDFGTLPSAQGFSYASTGGHADETESEVFSLAGGALDVNTMGDGPNTLTGSSAMYRYSGAVANAPLTLDVRFRIEESQFLSASSPLAHTLGFLVRPGAEYYFIAFNTQFAVDGDLIRRSWGTGFDVTQYHDYRWVVTPGGAGQYQLYVDGNLFMTGSRSSSTAHPSGLLAFGDATGGSNVHAQISYFRFTQGEPAPDFPSTEAVPEPGTLALLGLGLAALFMKRKLS